MSPMPSVAEINGHAREMGVDLAVEPRRRGEVVADLLNRRQEAKSKPAGPVGVVLSSSTVPLPDGSAIVVQVIHMPKPATT